MNAFWQCVGAAEALGNSASCCSSRQTASRSEPRETTRFYVMHGAFLRPEILPNAFTFESEACAFTIQRNQSSQSVVQLELNNSEYCSDWRHSRRNPSDLFRVLGSGNTVELCRVKSQQQMWFAQREVDVPTDRVTEHLAHRSFMELPHFACL